jgi:hypothetical protein
MDQEDIDLSQLESIPSKYTISVLNEYLLNIVDFTNK